MRSFLAVVLAFPLAAFAAEPVKLALNWKPEPQFGGFYAASLTKADEKRGLKFEILEGGSGTPTVQMLANGKVDFAVVSAEEIIINNERNPGNKVIALFATYQVNPQVILCRREKGFTSLKQVFESNVTLAMQSGLSYAQYLKAKYPKAKARIVPYAGGISNYVSDVNFCQQGFATSEPLLADKAGKPAKAFLVADEGFNPYTTVLAVREEMLSEKPEIAQKAVDAVRDGWSAYVNNPAETNKFMARLNKAMDAETFERSATAQAQLIHTTDPLGHMTSERWEQLAKQLKDLKVIKNVPPAESLFRILPDKRGNVFPK